MCLVTIDEDLSGFMVLLCFFVFVCFLSCRFVKLQGFSNGFQMDGFLRLVFFWSPSVLDGLVARTTTTCHMPWMKKEPLGSIQSILTQAWCFYNQKNNYILCYKYQRIDYRFVFLFKTVYISIYSIYMYIYIIYI